jgi:hypothetical protein
MDKLGRWSLGEEGKPPRRPRRGSPLLRRASATGFSARGSPVTMLPSAEVHCLSSPDLIRMRSILGLFGFNPAPRDRTWEILSKYFDRDFTAYPMAEGTVSPGQVDAVAAKLGVVYPPELRAHVLGRFPGIYVEVKEAVWPRPKPFEVGPFWSFLYALHSYTPAPASEDWMRLDYAGAAFQDETGLHAAPILRVVGDADLYCVDAKGEIVRYDHELNQLSPVGLDFWGLFDREMAELHGRKLRKAAGA